LAIHLQPFLHMNLPRSIPTFPAHELAEIDILCFLGFVKLLRSVGTVEFVCDALQLARLLDSDPRVTVNVWARDKWVWGSCSMQQLCGATAGMPP
jgi:hypothetical protein